MLAQEPEFALGELQICPSKREVIAGDAREMLQPRIMQVLVALARRRGDVVSRDELIACCWGGNAVSDDAIHRCIARIRRLSEAHGGFSLETVPRVGYQLTEIVPLRAAQAPPWRRGHFIALFLGLVLVAIAVVGLALLSSSVRIEGKPRLTLSSFPIAPVIVSLRI